MLTPKVFGHVNDAYVEVLHQLLTYGKPVNPRFKNTVELLNASFCLEQAGAGMLVNPTRKVNYQFMLAEWLWIALGCNDTQLIAPYNKQIGQFAEGPTFRGAYGPKWVEQREYVIDALRLDPNSRQAVVTLWRERPRDSKDIPCTLSFQFMIRAQEQYPRLDMIVNMRSNDAWLGLPYDVFTFTMLQLEVAERLGLPAGRYFHNVGSLHLYDKHVEVAKQLVHGQRFSEGCRSFTSVLPPMPEAFRAMFLGLTLLANQGDPNSAKNWVNLNAEAMPEPWGNYLRVLAYRFHRDLTQLSPGWQKVMEYGSR